MNLNWYSQGLMLAAMAVTVGGGNLLLAKEADSDAKVVEAKPVEAQPADEAKPEKQAAEQHFWIGAKMAAEVPTLLKRHLPQLADKGVYVEAVFDGSPASQAGLEADDVLLELNGQPLVEARKLVEAVRGGEGEKLKLVVLHNGQETTLEVTPRTITQEDIAAITQSEMMRGMAEQQPSDAMRMRFFGPGQLLPHAGARPALPQMGQNITVQIQHQGDQPAKLHIEKDGKSYDITADQLDQLPDDIRPLIEQSLGGMPFGQQGEIDIESLMPQGASGGMMQQQLQQIHKMLEEMKAQMRGQLPGQPQPPAAEDDHAI
ncbi:PDZ domain-containing protein [Blastopirellula marina]|uniref:Serine proteinase n=1 Tax=Blastopirellula marina DSM 3645 TaxID=314230 RepID=A3ZWU3_9BACT|nr:PDZ domain-containing protein [Blastopirellula marina]EAQ79067.1 serine proteinase [Blastopirellula marina DSM 3645]